MFFGENVNEGCDIFLGYKRDIFEQLIVQKGYKKAIFQRIFQ